MLAGRSMSAIKIFRQQTPEDGASVLMALVSAEFSIRDSLSSLEHKLSDISDRQRIGMLSFTPRIGCAGPHDLDCYLIADIQVLIFSI